MTRYTLSILALTVAATMFAVVACTGSGSGAETASSSVAAEPDSFLQQAESEALQAVGIDADDARSFGEVLAQSTEEADAPDPDASVVTAGGADATVLTVGGTPALDTGPVQFAGVIDVDDLESALNEGGPGSESYVVVVEGDQVKILPADPALSMITAISATASAESQHPDAQVARALTSQEQLLTGIWTRSINAVVLISTESEPRRSFFGFQTPDDSTGAGFFWDDQGHIVTNAHVVQSVSARSGFADEITVTTHSGIEYAARLVGADLQADLAVLKIDDPTADDSHTLPLGNSSALIPGMSAVALGHPFGNGQDFSMTHGIVSGLDREIQTTADPTLLAPGVIQTDADVNPGNSGGPLLNSAGEVIGVNTQIRSLDSTNSGVGFALPINLVHRIVDGIIENGAALRSYMGISMMPLSRIVGLTDIPTDLEGIYISVVGDDTPAESAGLRGDSGYDTAPQNIPVLEGDGDIIVGLNGIGIADINELRQFLTFNASPGDVMTLQIRRDGAVIDVPITLGSKADFE